MTERRRGIGRGLSAILPTSTEPSKEELREVPVELIVPNPNQPRKHFDERALVALAESLGERGVLQPVLVRHGANGTYELIAGERRWRAAQVAGLAKLPALVRPDDDQASLEIALIENMARQDLNPVEEAQACAMLVEDVGLTREEVGRRVGRSRAAVSNLLRLLELPENVLALIANGDLSAGHGRALLLCCDHAKRRELGVKTAREGWSVRTLESKARAADGGTSNGQAHDSSSGHGGKLHPDQQAAVDELSEAFAQALGRDVRISPQGNGFRLQLNFDSYADARRLAQSLLP